MKDRLAWEYMVTILCGQNYTEQDSKNFVEHVIDSFGEVKSTVKHNSKNDKQ